MQNRMMHTKNSRIPSCPKAKRWEGKDTTECINLKLIPTVLKGSMLTADVPGKHPKVGPS